MSLSSKHLVALRSCCGKSMDTYEVWSEYGTQRKEIEYKCGECGRVFFDAHPNPLTLRLTVKK